MRWEKVADKLFRNTDNGLWLAELGGQPMVLPVPGASVTDVQALVQSIVSLPAEIAKQAHEPDKEAAAAAPRR
jgi:hypothetical protein